MKKLLAILLLLPSLASAADANLTWQNATTNTDGSTIATTGDEALASTTVKYSVCVAGDIDTTFQEQVVPFPGENTVVNGLTVGEWCFRSYHTTIGGTNSADTSVISQVVTAPTPNPPNVFAVELIAYTFIKQNNRFVFLPVGTVPIDTQCDENIPVGPYHVVPRESVEWSGTVQPEVVVAKCG